MKYCDSPGQPLAKARRAAHDVTPVDNAQEVQKNLDEQIGKIDEQDFFETQTHELTQPWWEETEMSFYDGEGHRHIFKGK